MKGREGASCEASRQSTAQPATHILPMTFRILAFVVAFAAVARPAAAWDSIGHMIVAQIAWEQLTPEARAGVEEALGRFNVKKASDRWVEDAPYDFVTASCWMDDIRSLQDRYDFGPWHFVNFPPEAEGFPEPEAGEAPNVVWGIQRCLDIMAGREDDPAIDSDQAMVMLLHMVGDIHQPLHTTNRGGDMGGNLVTVRNMHVVRDEEAFGRKREGNLHSFWDSSYRRGFREGHALVNYEAPPYHGRMPAAAHLAGRDLVARPPPCGSIRRSAPRSWMTRRHGRTRAMPSATRATGN